MNVIDDIPLPLLNANEVGNIARVVLEHHQRVLLHGPPGIGKSTLATELARQISATGHNCSCICADPGSPSFGAPGAVTLADWIVNDWQVMAIEALCTLDAGRFRLPLITAVRRLAKSHKNGVLLIDAPGVVRGIAGRELLLGLVDAAEADAILTLTTPERPPALFNELNSLIAQLFVVHATDDAKLVGKSARAHQRTTLWNTYLQDNSEQPLKLAKINIIGTPPPPGQANSWVGRQVGLLRKGQTLAMAEVTHSTANQLTIKSPHNAVNFDSLLVRDARRSVTGLMETATPFATEPLQYVPPPDMTIPPNESGGPRIVGRVGSADVCLVNGVFGDPLLHLRLRHQRRSLLFDLGDGARLPARIAHQVTDVFISHAHIDHIGGFLWLMRSRIGDFPTCRLYGPPELSDHIAGFLQSILWDRVAERGPSFEVAELHNDRLRRFHLQAGVKGKELLDETTVNNGIILQDSTFFIRAVQLDHHTPVLAYSYEPQKEINIRKDRLKARKLETGSWLNELKQQLLAENDTAIIKLPDGSEADAASLGEELVLINPSKKLVYATDFADTYDNRQRIETLAHYAHTFFCEAYFVEANAEQAIHTGHLTTKACGEMAVAAEVTRLVPFHFSERYSNSPKQLYEEIQTFCPQVVRPKSMQLFETVKPDSVFSLDSC